VGVARIRKERFDVALERFVAAACLAQKRRALTGGARERVVIQPLDVLPPIRCSHAIFARFAVFAFNVVFFFVFSCLRVFVFSCLRVS
jgi:hypothetical protein